MSFVPGRQEVTHPSSLSREPGGLRVWFPMAVPCSRAGEAVRARPPKPTRRAELAAPAERAADGFHALACPWRTPGRGGGALGCQPLAALPAPPFVHLPPSVPHHPRCLGTWPLPRASQFLGRGRPPSSSPWRLPASPSLPPL